MYIYIYTFTSPETPVASESHPKLRRRRLRNALHLACCRRCLRSQILSASWRVLMLLARKTRIELRSQKLMFFWPTPTYVHDIYSMPAIVVIQIISQKNVVVYTTAQAGHLFGGKAEAVPDVV